METYGKLLDLFDLLMELQASCEGISLQDIQNKFNVSRRTAERMRNALLAYFPQMEEVDTGEKTKRWRLPQRSLKSLVSFSSEELSVFKTAIDLLQHYSTTENAQTLKNVELKLRNLINPDLRNRISVDAESLMQAEGLVFYPGPKIQIAEEIIIQIRQAILSCHHIKIKYKSKLKGKISDYRLVPYGFLYGQRDHYLVAKHSDNYDNGKAHNYSLQNILEVEILPDISTPDNFDLAEYTKESFGAWHEDPIEVEWLFSPKVADEAKKYIFHPTQQLIENENGSLTVKFKAGGIKEMDWFLYTWGDEVTVIKPAQSSLFSKS